MENERRLMNINEVAEYLDLSIHTIYSWSYRNKIPRVKIGRLVKFDKKDIDWWLEQQKEVNTY